MLRAAYELFCDRGYVGTTMSAIAERAGMAVQTLYFTFNTKSALLEEAFGAAVVGFEHWEPRVVDAVSAGTPRDMIEVHPWYPEFRDAPTAAAALAVFVDASLPILERVGPLLIAMTAAGDPDVTTVAEIAERRRVEGYAFVAEDLAERQGWRRGMTPQRATDILLCILSAETHTFLTSRRGWSQDACREWFLDVLCQQLFEPPAA
jgi:AcrR family transcriptional regulator